MNKTETKIREAKVEDLAILKMFEQEIIRYERPFGPNLKDDPLEYYDLLDFIQREDAQVIVATIDEKIVGSGYALTKKSASYVRFEYHAYLGFMYVLPQFRGKGINRKIIENLIDWAKKRGLTEIQLEVYAENESALKAYKRSNFKPDLLRMRFNTEE